MGVLITCWGSLGEVRPYRWLALRLHENGQRVVVSAPALFKDLFTGITDRFEPLPPDSMAESPESLAGLFHPRHSVERLFGGLLDGAMAAQRDSVLRLLSSEPRLERALCSWIAPGALLACRERGLNPIQCHLYPQSLMQAADPPVFMRWPRLTRAAGGRYLTSARLLQSLSERGRALAPELSRLQGEAGVEEAACGWLAVAPPPWPRLALFPPDFLRVPEPGVRHLANHWSSIVWPVPPAIMEFLGEGPPPVLITLGSAAAGDAGALLTAVAKAAQEVGGQGRGGRVICHVGLRAQGIERRSDRLLLVSGFSPTGLLPHVCAVVHHAGMNSLQEALAHGLPSLSLPRAFDQLDNALRLQDLGLGLCLPPNRQDPEEIRRSLEALLSDPAHSQAARRWRSEGRHAAGLPLEEALAIQAE